MGEERPLVDYLESADFLKASSNSTRLVSKLKSAILRRELYETHQIIRTIYFRFINIKEKVFALENLLFEGSCYLLKVNEEVSGQDIATLFLEVAAKCLKFKQEGEQAKVELHSASLQYHEQNRTLSLQICEKVSKITVNLPDTEIGQSKFVAETLKILSPKLVNRSLLHNILARRFRLCQDFTNSRYHYLYCASLENASDLAELLVEYQLKSANKSEVDLFITQLIFQVLCLQHPSDSPRLPNQSNAPISHNPAVTRKTRNAIKEVVTKIFTEYTRGHPSLGPTSAPFDSLPLLNFTYFIISSLDSAGESELFRTLRDIYRATWSRDPNYEGYLTRIGSLYFGVCDDKSQRPGGSFNNFFLSLLEDEDDPNQEAISSSDELD